MTKKFFRFKKLLRTFIFINVFLFCLYSSYASDNYDSPFSVNEREIYFEKSEKPIKNIVITNTSKSTLYIQGKIKKILNDNFDDPKYDDTKEIIITPKNSAISPNESVTFRIVYLPSTSKVENQYALFFTPYNKDFSKPDTKDTFTVNITSDPLIIKDSLTILRDKEHITFKNNGNRSVYIYDAKSCDKDYCDKLFDIRIAKNTELKLAIEKNKLFECTKKVGNKYQKVIVKY